MGYNLIDFRKSIPRHKTRTWKKRYKADKIVVHTTASDNQDPSKTARYHVHAGETNHISTKGCPSIVYHDFIDKTGTVFHCNDYTDWTWHASAYNRRSIGVTMAFKGQSGEAPTPEQFMALERHLVILCLYLKIYPKDVIGHREVPGMWTWIGKGSKKYKKTCPGMKVDLDKLRERLTKNLQRRLFAEGLYLGRIDGDFGPKSSKALKDFVPKQNRVIQWESY